MLSGFLGFCLNFGQDVPELLGAFECAFGVDVLAYGCLTSDLNTGRTYLPIVSHLALIKVKKYNALILINSLPKTDQIIVSYC